MSLLENAVVIKHRGCGKRARNAPGFRIIQMNILCGVLMKDEVKGEKEHAM